MHGDHEAAQDALRRGADADATYDSRPALFWAAQEGHTSIVDLLLDAGANVNLADPEGFTPLKQAIGESHLDTAEHLRRFTILAVKKNGGGSPRRGKGVNANPTPIPV
jgi:ankyrin repeat protein